ncbi:ATPase Cu transporting protein 7B [Apophysomyces sp. BC1034]|nr:ATPase Cu transporting protein 7B [Apophysomyces sp. BC1015]KAG0171689.1 ATPase Cu transporting protein 7B [Apophysomyces sp. BC1021]KAG0184915.1 ATPase Cu transporting protein 7B [Apophysomyces sp. BC1034]
MTCQHCVNAITKVLQDVPGAVASSVSVDLKNASASLTVNTNECNRSLPEIKQLISRSIEDAGYDAGTPQILSDDNDNKSIHATLFISGMTCSHCVNTVTRALEQLPSVIPESIEVSLDLGKATVAFADASVSETTLQNTVQDLGYDVDKVQFGSDLKNGNDNEDEATAAFRNASMSISGMTCSHCVQTVTGALQNLPGVFPESVQVDLTQQSGTLAFQGTEISPELLTATIQDLGYEVVGRPHITVGDQHQLSLERTLVEESNKPRGSSVSDGWRKVVMRVLGMTCESCVATMTDILEHDVQNVQKGSVRVNLETEMAMFICQDPDIDEVRNVVDSAGYIIENVQVIHNLIQPAGLGSQEDGDHNEEDSQSRRRLSESIISLRAVTVETPTTAIPKKVKLHIGGMTCSSCVRKVEIKLATLPGVVSGSTKVNLLTGTGSFSVTGDVLDEKTIRAAVSHMGYTASNVVIIAEEQQKPQLSGGSGLTLQTKYKVNMVISGMFCPNCIDKLQHALASLPGAVSSTIEIDLGSGRTSFEFTGDSITRKSISQAVLQLGFMADSIDLIKIQDAQKQDKKESTMATTRLMVTGMTCSSCVANIERSISKQAGIYGCQVNLLAKSAVIQHDASVVGARTLANLIEQIGYHAEIAQNTMDSLQEQRLVMQETMNKEIEILRRRFYWSLVFAIPVVLISMIFMMALPMSNAIREGLEHQVTAGLSIGDLVLFLLATPVQFWLGWPFYVKAYQSLRYAHTANMETLVAMGTTVAYVASVAAVAAQIARQARGAMALSYFETSVLLITFIHLGKWLEAMAKGKTAETITKLLDLQPDRAILVDITIKEGKETLVEREIDANDVQAGDILKVNAGGRIPCDGKLWRGATSADESMITGESVPVNKKEGDNVISATINLSAPIYIRAIRVGSDTTLSRIIQMVQDAQASPKAPIEQLADNISSVFVPIVIVLAVLTFVVWEVLSVKSLYPETWVPVGENKTIFSLMLAVSVLVIACPCGLGLASPTAVMVGTGVAARYGVLVKGGGYALEMANRITTIAFDKTGTLTLGKPAVTDSWVNSTVSSSTTDDVTPLPTDVVWKIMGRVASASNHPLSKSIEKHARKILLGPRRKSDASEDTAVENQDDEDAAEDTIDAFEGVSITNAKEVAGRGLMATLTLSADDGIRFPGGLGQKQPQQHRVINVFLGNQKWMNENHARYEDAQQAVEAHRQLDDWQSKGNSIVLISAAPVATGTDSRSVEHQDGCNNACACVVCQCSTGSVCCSSSKTIVLAQLAIADVARPESSQVVFELRRKGIEVWMVTGDNAKTARVIASQLGIDENCVLADVKPEQKADKIRSLQRRGVRDGRVKSRKPWKRNQDRTEHEQHNRAVVAMIGDGINDSPALAQADVGISVGSATDVAIEAASIVLIRNNLLDLITMYDISRKVVRRIRINFFWAFMYNVCAIPIAAGILYPGTGHTMPAWVAGIAMVVSSISVVCSSLLLRLYKPPKVALTRKV